MHHLPECIGEQRKTHRYVSKILLYQLCFILFDIFKFHLQEVSVLNRLEDHYYVYRALLQMVEMVLTERTLDCICKKRHAKKWMTFSRQYAEWITCCGGWLFIQFIFISYRFKDSASYPCFLFVPIFGKFNVFQWHVVINCLFHFL